jgi:hypothetical protein
VQAEIGAGLIERGHGSSLNLNGALFHYFDRAGIPDAIAFDRRVPVHPRPLVSENGKPAS